MFSFNSVIYSGLDLPQDGIGKNLALLDGLIFNQPEIVRKSLCETMSHRGKHDTYGKIESFDHLVNPENYQGSLYLDVSRDMLNCESIEQQRCRALDFKKHYGAVTAIYLFWESDRLTEDVVDLLKAYDFCLVTAHFLVPELRYYNVDYVVVDHPYDFMIVDPTTIETQVRPPVLRFGVSAGLWRRKNVSLLTQKFVEVFGTSSQHFLSIHTRFDPEHDANYHPEYSRIEKFLQDYPNIEVINEHLSNLDYLNWLRSLHVYCFPSSGEGYSVTPREALHLGKPVVLSNAHVHRRLCKFPGVVPVSVKGMKPASPTIETLDIDVGYDWTVDERSLADGLVTADRNYLELTRALSEHYTEILKAHDLDNIKRRWMDALNSRYQRYKGNNHQNVYASEIFLSEWKRHFTPRMFNVLGNGLQHNTGEIIGNRLYCYANQHVEGHCVYGPDYKILITRKYVVEFYLRFLSIYDHKSSLVSLDVYDHKRQEIIAFQSIVLPETFPTLGRFSLDFSGKRDQVLEFRVFWHGTSDLEVSKVVLRPVCLSKEPAC